MAGSSEKSADTSVSLDRLLSRNDSIARKKRVRNWLVSAVLLILVTGVTYYYRGSDTHAGQVRYITEPVRMGTLIVRVSATGNLQPTNQVDVGSELSGIVEEVMVDDNDQVSKDQILARLDLSRLQDDVARSQANLDAAEAQVMQAHATVEESAATLSRLQKLAAMSETVAPADSELDTARANLKRAEANLASARASVTQVRAELQSDKTSLEKAYIRSPIDGVVLSRKVETGQTVAASFQAPVLFTLAEDLANMELQVNVDEADVGKIEVGQQATFSVDAWPGRSYKAVITKIGYGATETEGVVTFPATLQVDNTDLSLRPGMTATAEITTLVRENVLLVPNAALRYAPSVAEAETDAQRGSLLARLFRGPPRNRGQQVTVTVDGNRQTVWLLRNDTPVPLEVTIGASDGSVTEITGSDLQAGMQLITDTLSE